MSTTDVVIDLGNLKIKASEMLEIIEEERKKLLARYGVNDLSDIQKLYSLGRLSIDEIMELKHKLTILDEMEEAIYEEIFIRQGKYTNVLVEKLLPLLKLIH